MVVGRVVGEAAGTDDAEVRRRSGRDPAASAKAVGVGGIGREVADELRVVGAAGGIGVVAASRANVP
jgi:hypothetical protein